MFKLFIGERRSQIAGKRLLFAERRVDDDEIDTFIVEGAQERQVVADENSAVEIF